MFRLSWSVFPKFHKGGLLKGCYKFPLGGYLNYLGGFHEKFPLRRVVKGLK